MKKIQAQKNRNEAIKNGYKIYIGSPYKNCGTKRKYVAIKYLMKSKVVSITSKEAV